MLQYYWCWIKRFEFINTCLTYGWAILGAAIGPQIILILFRPHTNANGTLAGIWTGFIVAVVWPQVYVGKEVEVYNLPLAFVLAFAVNWIVSSINFKRRKLD